ncbi:hypothetical protein CTYAZ2_12200 [Comamonas testosteroni]|nr:hypothetical protein CTYAZ2_12200 [Comamonas testosteroni]
MNAITTPPGLTISSRDIAELTGKRHADVMRDIRTLMDALEQNADLRSVCISSTYVGDNEQRYPQYELDKDTSLTLLLGYDPVARMKVVKRWQELEAQQTPALPNFADPVAAARAWADAKECEQKAVAQLALAAPKVEFVERYVQPGTGSMGVREVCKLLGAKLNAFTDFLLKRGLMYRTTPKSPLTPRAEHMHNGRFEAKTGTAEHGETSHAFVHYKFTAKGVEWIAGLWCQHQVREKMSSEVPA